MNNHLPECLMNLEYAVRVCICYELRACERRVRRSLGQECEEVIRLAASKAHTAALRDAKAAVMAVSRSSWGLKVHEHYRNCIAAIEVLKEKP